MANIRELYRLWATRWYLQEFFSWIGHDHDSEYSPANHNHDSEYSPANHNHDDRYYTEGEIDDLISGLGGGDGSFMWDGVWQQQSSGAAGTATSGSDFIRVLNNTVYAADGYSLDTDGGVYLPSGIYWAVGWAVGYRVARHHSLLSNGIDTHRGQVAYAASGYYGCTRSNIEMVIITSGTPPDKWYLKHRVESTMGSDGQGTSPITGVGVSAMLKVKRIGDQP